MITLASPALHEIFLQTFSFNAVEGVGFSGELPALQHGCFSCSLTDVGLHGCASYVLNSLCNRTAEDGNGFLVDVLCVLVNVRTLSVLSCSGCPFWSVLISFLGCWGHSKQVI